MENKKFDVRMLLPLLLVPLLIPLYFVARIRRKRRKARELAAARALARRLAEERESGKGKAKKGKKGAGKAETVEKGAKAGSFFARRGAAYRKRLIRFVIVLGLERLIAARRAKMAEEIPSNSLLKRFSKAKDI